MWSVKPEMHHELRTFASIDELATGAADFIAEHARLAIATSGTFSLALSGGNTPWAMLTALSRLDIDWDHVVIFQVDERVAPPHDASRNIIHIRDCLASAQPNIVAMPVNDDDLDDAAFRYGALLPERFDLVHLGLGPDGHTASLVPGDPALHEMEKLVTCTGPYQGRRRMTLTYPALARADRLLWLVSGEDKTEALRRLLDGDTSIPAGRVVATRSMIMADAAATPVGVIDTPPDPEQWKADALQPRVRHHAIRERSP